MYQLSNIDKKQWNLNETSILIPIINSSLPKERDKKVRTVNSIARDEEHNTPAGNVEHNLVISLNENLLEPHHTKTDLLIIQDTDLKLISCNSSLKDQLGYSLSYVGQERSGIIWENTDKPKEWPQENAILLVKDNLVYDKLNEGDNFHELKSGSHDKVEEHVQRDEVIKDERNNGNYQINYIPEHYRVSSKKEIRDDEIPPEDVRDGYQNMFRGGVNKVKASDNHNEEYDKPGSKVSKVKQKNGNVMLEKNLPLKKKAKMKKTMIAFDKQKSLLKQELLKNRHNLEESSPESKKYGLQYNTEQDCSYSDSDELNSRNKRRKFQQKAKKAMQNFPIEEVRFEQSVELEKESTKIDMSNFDISKFKDIYDLVEGLRKYRMISVTVWQILNTGLREMNVNILEEIIKKNEDPKGGNYSPQLKAFALVLYFKQPVAFNFLAKVCNNGWPSLNVIKEWKQQLNNYQRPNFVGVERNMEDDVL